MVVASVLMAMGMLMLSPIIISLPFKIMLFVLVDGWALIMGTLAASYGI
jgi:flagellar biosynthetic protein FliP